MKDYLVFGGVNSLDYQVYVADVNQFDGARKSVEIIKIPGKNGSLSISDGSYENITLSYSLFVKHNARKNLDSFKARINAINGYVRLADSISPDHFRLARYNEKFTTDVSDKEGAALTLVFDCDPRKFLKNGEKIIDLTGSAAIKNPTHFEALPLIRVYGTGTVTIAGVAVTINSANVYTDIDCELQEAYKGSTNCNGNITLGSGKFPTLKTGSNSIYLAGVSKIELTPRWWTI